MSEYGIGREADTDEEPAAAGELVEELAEESAEESAEEPAEAEEYAESYGESYADPQEWIGSLIAKLDRAEQGIGSGPRDALMARIKLAQAYSELGDTVQAAPLAVANVAQARRLFPSSEGMLRQLREFRDAACEAAGWTAAMMREEAEAGEDGSEAVSETPSELAARPDVEAPAQVPVPNATPAPDAALALDADPAEDFAVDDEAPASPLGEPESVGAVIHEFVRRPQDPDATQWAAETPAALPQPAELAIPTPPEPEYAEEVEPALASADLADLSDLADLAALEEIIRLRYELRESQRTIERLRHVNRKLREALEFDEG
jgi:hypothetical protein